MARRTRRSVLVGAALAAGLAGCSYPQPRGPVGFNDGFESGIGDWDRGADVGEGEWTIAATDEASASGFRSARFELGARVGRLWLERRVGVEPGTIYEANLAAAARGEGGDLVLFVGAAPPTEGGFPTAGGLREPFPDADWRTHAVSRTVRTGDAGALHVAVGAAAGAGAATTGYVDDVKLTLVAEP